MSSEFEIAPVKSAQLLSEQVYEHLVARLVEGDFPPGFKLPAESVLAKSLGVSRVSLREALQRLELEGYIERKRGVGTFVIDRHPTQVEAGIEKLISMSEVIRSRGYVPGTKKTELFSRTADAHIAARLGLTEGDPVTVINRVRTIDGQPIFWDSNQFPSKFFPATTPSEAIGESLFAYCQNVLGFDITHSVARLLPDKVDKFLSKELEVPVGELLIKLAQVHYLKDNSPIWYSTLLYRESEFSWYIVRTR